MMLSRCDICGSEKSKFIKKQEASAILSSLGLKTPLNKIPLLGDIFFYIAISLNAFPRKIIK